MINLIFVCTYFSELNTSEGNKEHSFKNNFGRNNTNETIGTNGSVSDNAEEVIQGEKGNVGEHGPPGIRGPTGKKGRYDIGILSFI